jgi:hypothetical protein
MLKGVIQRGIIHTFKPTSTNEIYENWGKGICEICDEHFDVELSEHECSHKEFSLLILHQEIKDELMVIVNQEVKKEEDQEKSVKVDDMGKKVRELDKCEDQIINEEENL